jgi:hypothetical protein
MDSPTIQAGQVKDYEPSEAEKKVERILIYKNVLLISVSFLLLFVAFESMSKLQSSINTVGDDQSGTLVTIGTNFTVIKFVFFTPADLYLLYVVKNIKRSLLSLPATSTIAYANIYLAKSSCLFISIVQYLHVY